jgi:signal transduction histidine kinase
VIVKRIAELHDGYVFVQSVQGHGSTFGIRLPLKLA